MVNPNEPNTLDERIQQMLNRKESPIIAFRTNLNTSDLTSIIKATYFGMSVALFNEARIDAEKISETLRVIGIQHTVQSFSDGMLFYIPMKDESPTI